MFLNLQFSDLLYDPACRWRFSRPAPDHGGVWKEMEYSVSGRFAAAGQLHNAPPIEYFAVWGQERGLFRDPARAAEVVVEAFAKTTTVAWRVAAQAVIRDLVSWYFGPQLIRWAFVFSTAAKPTITGIARLRQGDVRNTQVQRRTLATKGRFPRTYNLGGGLPNLPIADSHLRFAPLDRTPESQVEIVQVEQRREFLTPEGGRRTQFERLLLPVEPERDRRPLLQGQVPGLEAAFEPTRHVVNLPAIYCGVLIAPTLAATRIDDFFVQDCFCHLRPDEAWMPNLTCHGRSLRSFLQMNPVFCEMLVQQGVLVCE